MSRASGNTEGVAVTRSEDSCSRVPSAIGPREVSIGLLGGYWRRSAGLPGAALTRPRARQHEPAAPPGSAKVAPSGPCAKEKRYTKHRESEAGRGLQETQVGPAC